MPTWLLLGDSRDFDVNAYVKPQRDILWLVQDRRLVPDIRAGDQVYVWRSGEDSPDAAGIVACGVVTGAPAVRRATDFVTWLRTPPDATEPTIMVRMDDVRLNVRAGCLPRSDIAQDTILRELGSIEQTGKGICLLTDAEEQRLGQVWPARRVQDL